MSKTCRLRQLARTSGATPAAPMREQKKPTCLKSHVQLHVLLTLTVQVLLQSVPCIPALHCCHTLLLLLVLLHTPTATYFLDLMRNVFAFPAAVAVAIRHLFLCSFADCCEECCKENDVHISVDKTARCVAAICCCFGPS